MIPDARHLTNHLERNILAGYVVPSEIDQSGGTLAEKFDQLKIVDIHDTRLEEGRRGCIRGWRRKGRSRASESGGEECRRVVNVRRIFKNRGARQQRRMRNDHKVLEGVQRLGDWRCYEGWALDVAEDVVAGLREGNKGELQGGIESVLHGTANVEYSRFVIGVAEGF